MKSKVFLALFLIYTSIFFTSCSFNQESLTKAENKEPEKVKLPSDEEIEKGRELVAKFPEMAKGYVTIASGFLKKVRETGDYSFNRQAEENLQKALEIESENTDARLLQTQIYLSEHKFNEALELANKISEKQPGDTAILSAIVDAQTELGRYEEAVKSAQKLVDSKPNSSSYTRVAHLRNLHGDIKGGLEARRLALKIADPLDKEQLAWLHSELGKDLFNSGNFSEAGQEFEKALEVFPEYHWALAGKGKVLASQGDLTNAVEIYQKLYQKTLQADRGIFLGDLLQKLGKNDEAWKIYNEIIKREREASEGDLHRLAMFWADHDTNLDEALEIAMQDRQENNDLLASDTLAWCLYKKGKFVEAKKYMAEALRIKSKNAQFYYHLGMIEKALNNKTQASKHLKTALEINPSFDILQAEIAKKTLAELE